MTERRPHDGNLDRVFAVFYLVSLVVCIGGLRFLTVYYGLEDPVTVAFIVVVGTIVSFWPVVVAIFMAVTIIVLGASFVADLVHS